MSTLPREFGDYTLLAEVGRGAMGVVYRAEQKSLKRTVALKVLETSRQFASDELLARFEREGKIMAKLDHPDIVAVHDSGIELDKLFIAMEFVGGMSLDRYLRSRLPDLKESLGIVSRVARALDHAHGLGIVHRDIKPSNILIDEDGNPKLSDFGVAKAEGTRLTRSGGLVGTPIYMSPEQARGQAAHADPRSDLYSLGVVLYEMLTGAPPHVGTSVEAVVQKVIHEDPLPPRTLDRKIPRDIETICLKALSKDPAKRYSTAVAFAEDIDRYLRGETILARRAGVPERAWKWSLRNRGVVAVAAAALAFAGTGLYLLARLRETERRPFRRAAIDEHYRKGEYAKVLDLLEADDHLLRAICLRETGRRDDAETSFAAHLERFPDDAAAWRHRALNALEGGDLDHAVGYYREAASHARIPRTDVADAAREYDALIAMVEGHYLPLDPQHARPHLASYYWDYNFAATPMRYYTFGYIGPWVVQFEHTALAAASLEDLMALFKKYGDHPVLLGWRAVKSDGEASLRDLDRAIEVIPVSRWLRYHRMSLLLKLKRPDEAAKDRAVLDVLVPGDVEFRKLLDRLR